MFVRTPDSPRHNVRSGADSVPHNFRPGVVAPPFAARKAGSKPKNGVTRCFLNPGDARAAPAAIPQGSPSREAGSILNITYSPFPRKPLIREDITPKVNLRPVSELSSEVQHLDQQFSNSLFHKSAAETKCSTLRGLALINARPRSRVFGETRERFRPLG